MSKIYISSISDDLKESRQAAVDALRQAGHEVFVSEYLGPYTASAMLEILLRNLEDSDAYVGIFSQNYEPMLAGAENPEQLSMAHYEYRRAKSLQLPCLIFLTPDSKWPNDAASSDKMAIFRQELMRNQPFGVFSSPDDLSAKLVAAAGNVSPRSFDVFLSHNSKDQEAVGIIAERLRKDGIRVWWDKGNLLPGDEWKFKTDAAFLRTPVVAVFIGPNGTGRLQNQEIQTGLARADSGHLLLIPVLLPGASHELVPPFLAIRQWVDFGPSLDNPVAYNLLKNAILGRPATAQPVPPVPPVTDVDLQMLPDLLFRLVARLRQRPEMLQSLEVTAFWAAVRKIQSGASTIEDLRSLNTQLASEPAPGALWAAWIRNTRSTELAAILQHPPSPVVA